MLAGLGLLVGEQHLRDVFLRKLWYLGFFLNRACSLWTKTLLFWVWFMRHVNPLTWRQSNILQHWGLLLKLRIICCLRLAFASVSYVTLVKSQPSFKAPPKKVSSEVKLLKVIRARTVSEDESRLLFIRLDDWKTKWQLKMYADKCKAMQMKQNSPSFIYQMIYMSLSCFLSEVRSLSYNGQLHEKLPLNTVAMKQNPVLWIIREGI